MRKRILAFGQRSKKKGDTVLIPDMEHGNLAIVA